MFFPPTQYFLLAVGNSSLLNVLAAAETQCILDALKCSSVFYNVKEGNLCRGGGGGEVGQKKRKQNGQVRFYPGVRLGYNLSLAVVGINLPQEGKLTLHMQTWG